MSTMSPTHASLLHNAILAGRTDHLTQVMIDVSRASSRSQVLEFVESGIRTPARVQYRAAEDLIWNIWSRLYFCRR